MINQKSLDNLKKPKPKKADYGYRYSLPQEKIDSLFTFLAEGMSLKKAAAETKICFETARKYFREGDSKRGIKPLHYRLTLFQDKISEKFNVLLEERRIAMLSTVRDTISTLEKKMAPKDCVCCDGQGFQIPNAETGIKELCKACEGEGKMITKFMGKSSLKDLERFMRLEVFLLGGVTTKEHDKKMLSAEEISESA